MIAEAILAMTLNKVYGVGINDWPEKIGPLVKPSYNTWVNMLMRAYDPKWHEKYTTYVGVSVSEEWLVFSVFKDWFDKNYKEGWDLDKDILSNSKEYGPESSLYIPPWLNTFLNDQHRKRGEYPIGVYFHKKKNKFVAQGRHPLSKVKEHLGYFDNPEDAHSAWKTRKLDIAKELKSGIDSIDIRLYPRIEAIINSMS